MLNGILAVVAILMVALVAYVLTRPAHFRVERSILIKAEAEDVFQIISDLRQWDAWSPWSRRDPQMKKTLSGAEFGPGAVYAWDGDKRVGKGRMEITAAEPHRLVRIKLDFLSPFEAHNTVEFTLQPQGGDTRVTWAMFGPNTLMSKVMGLFMSMEKMVGPDFETGLASLKGIAEA